MSSRPSDKRTRRRQRQQARDRKTIFGMDRGNPRRIKQQPAQKRTPDQ